MLLTLSACSNQIEADSKFLNQKGSGVIRQKIDYEKASQTLGVSQDELQNLIKFEEGQRPDFENAAIQLGITVDELRTALGFGQKNFNNSKNTSKS